MRTLRPLVLIGVVAVLAACLVMVACGDGDGDDGSGDDSAPGVAMILPGKATDAGYSQVGATGLEQVAQELGSETSIAETVPIARQVETFRDFAEQGIDIVIGWGGQWTDGAAEVAPDFPDTTFIVTQGVGGNGDNFGTVDLASEQWTYVLGAGAARLTETKKIGVVAGPCFDATSREIHGYEQGVNDTDGSVDVRIVGLDDFDDPVAAKEAAQALIDDGVDVLHTNLNTGVLGVIEAVEGTDVLLSTQFVDQASEAPENIWTNDQRDLSSIVLAATETVADGSFEGEPIRVEMTADEKAFNRKSKLAPAGVFAEMADLQNQIVDGEITAEPNGECPY